MSSKNKISPSVVLGARLTLLMQERHISCEKLGNKLYISGGSISAYRVGKTEPSLTTIVKLCEMFDVSADWLLGLTEVRK